jgi:transposase
VSALLAQKDGATTRIATEHGDLVCDFSAKRYRKDKYEMEKQITNAEALIAKNEPGKRAKFIAREDDKETYALNDALVEKTTLLLGVKEYYTNIPEGTLSNKDVVLRYHDPWNVEASFRMSKSDLATRLIFHHKEDAVRAHMVVCFVALAVGRYLERATRLSLRSVRDALWSVTDAQIFDAVTKETIILRSEVNEGVVAILKKLGLSH